MLDLLAQACHHATTTVTNQVAPHHPALRPAHLNLFRTQDIDGKRLTELAASAGITKQSMHELVTHLAHEGYLTRARDPEDNRRQRLEITDKGRTLRAELKAAETHLEEAWRRQLGDESYTALNQSLSAMTTR